MNVDTIGFATRRSVQHSGKQRWRLSIKACVTAILAIVGMFVLCVGGFALVQIPRQRALATFASLEQGTTRIDIANELGPPLLDVAKGDWDPMLIRAGVAAPLDQRVLIYHGSMSPILAYLFFDDNERLDRVIINDDD